MWPDVDEDIRLGLAFDALPALQIEDADLVISSDLKQIPGIEFTPTLDYTPVLVASSEHPLAQKKIYRGRRF